MFASWALACVFMLSSNDILLLVRYHFMIHVRYMISFKFCYRTNISFLVPFTHFNPVQCVLGYNSLHLFLSGDDPIDSVCICSISCEKSPHSMSVQVDYVGAMRTQSSIIVLVNSVSASENDAK